MTEDELRKAFESSDPCTIDPCLVNERDWWQFKAGAAYAQQQERERYASARTALRETASRLLAQIDRGRRAQAEYESVMRVIAKVTIEPAATGPDMMELEEGGINADLERE